MYRSSWCFICSSTSTGKQWRLLCTVVRHKPLLISDSHTIHRLAPGESREVTAHDSTYWPERRRRRQKWNKLTRLYLTKKEREDANRIGLMPMGSNETISYREAWECQWDWIDANCWRLQDWILKVGLQSLKTIHRTGVHKSEQQVGLESCKTAIKLHRSAQQNKTKECNGTHYELCRSQEWRWLMVIPVVETSGSQECVGGTCKFL
jgi:hypothetical protein